MMDRPKVIFVGMHNKPGTLPLCGSTKTGKLINRIISTLSNDFDWNLDHEKTNLWDVEYFPVKPEERQELSEGWFYRIQPKVNDIVVLLGKIVHDHFIDCGCKVVKVAHPASKRSHEEMAEYVSRTVALIKEKAKRNDLSKMPPSAAIEAGPKNV